MNFRRILIALLLAMILGPLLLAKIMLSCGRQAGASVSLSKYHKVLKEIPQPLATHFPQNLPRDPSRVRLSRDSSSGFGQGGYSQTELWMKLEPGGAERLFEEFDKRRLNESSPANAEDTRRFWGVFCTVIADDTTSVPVTTEQKRQSGYALHSLPDDFAVIKLDNAGVHMWYRGVAISKKRGEIIYYAGYSYAM